MKNLSKFIAAFAAVSMLASVTPVVNADETVSFKTTKYEYGVIIEGAENADDLNVIEIPAEIEGNKVVGIADFAFADLDNIMTIDTKSAVNLTPEYVSSCSFVTKYTLLENFITIFGEDATEQSILTTIANEVYGKKPDGETWSAEELTDVKAKIAAKAVLAGTTLPDDFTDATALTETAAIMLQNEDALNLNELTSDSLDIWVSAITYDYVEVLYTDDSAIKDIIVNLPLSPAGLSGDANNDGKVNVRDAAFIASKLAKGEGDSLPAEADFNNDSKINVRDAAAIAFALAKGDLNPDITITITY